MPRGEGGPADSDREVSRAVRPTPESEGEEDEKRIDMYGHACPNPNCDYHRITDPTLHALVGYGHHGQHDPLHASRFYCQAGQHTFSARRHTALYRLKTPPTHVAQVWHAMAEGLSAQAAARVFQLSETTVRSWLSRAGQHSQSLHDRLMSSLQLTHIQLDELRLKLRAAAEAAWLWTACDARTRVRVIPAFTLGPRTQAMAPQLVHEVAQRLAPGCLPSFASDGLALYFFARTAHCGQWVQTVGERQGVHTDQRKKGLDDGHPQRIVITAPHHPLYGQNLKVARRTHEGGEPHFVVELPNSHTQLIPARWTDAVAAPGGSNGEPLLFNPGSLRALVRMVAHLRTQQQPEATHEPIARTLFVDELQCGGASATDVSLDRPAPSPDPSPSVASERSDR